MRGKKNPRFRLWKLKITLLENILLSLVPVCCIFYFFLVFTSSLLASPQKLLPGIWAQAPGHAHASVLFFLLSLFSALAPKQWFVMPRGIMGLLCLVVLIEVTLCWGWKPPSWCVLGLGEEVPASCPASSHRAPTSHAAAPTDTSSGLPSPHSRSCPVEFARTWDHLPSVPFSSTALSGLSKSFLFPL